MLRYIVEYSEDLPEQYGGYCYFPWVPLIGTCRIVIRPKYTHDIGLLNHELTHCKQYATNIFHGLLWAFSKKYRLKCELEAYRIQVETYGYTELSQVRWVIHMLVHKYNFGLIEKEAESLVKQYVLKES